MRNSSNGEGERNMRFLALFAKDLSDEFEDLTEFQFQAHSWSGAVIKAEEHAVKIKMELDSLSIQA